MTDYATETTPAAVAWREQQDRARVRAAETCIAALRARGASPTPGAVIDECRARCPERWGWAVDVGFTAWALLWNGVTT